MCIQGGAWEESSELASGAASPAGKSRPANSQGESTAAKCPALESGMSGMAHSLYYKLHPVDLKKKRKLTKAI
jgi:hypothetical protein